MTAIIRSEGEYELERLRRVNEELRAQLASARKALEPQAVRADERLACWKIAEEERKNAPVDKQAWLVAFDIANAIKMRDQPEPTK